MIDNAEAETPEAPETAAPEPKRPDILKKLNLKHIYLHKPPPLEFVLPGIIKGSVGGIVSAGGQGKSMLALQLAVSLSSMAETPLRGAFGEPDLMQISYISAEDPEEVLSLRIYDIMHAPGNPMTERQIDAFHSNCSIFCGYGESIDLMADRGEEILRQAAQGRQLVIVDTMRRTHNQDENDNGAMAQVLKIAEKIAKQTGAAILFLHHVPKTSTSAGLMREISARGASSITDNMRYVGALRPITDPEALAFGVDAGERWKHVIYTSIKCNYSAPLPDQWFVRGAGGVLSHNGENSAVLAAAAAATPAATKAAVKQKNQSVNVVEDDDDEL